MDEQDMQEIERIECEAGCELPELSNATWRQRAQRLLDCEDPPRGDDLALCERIARE
jgi:hypothetical protein